ncbi:hypothetical protein ABTH91_21315, partial [Acinetobacter baumannii]
AVGEEPLVASSSNIFKVSNREQRRLPVVAPGEASSLGSGYPCFAVPDRSLSLTDLLATPISFDTFAGALKLGVPKQ